MNSRTATEIENVTEGTCWDLLGTEQIGRLAVTAQDGVDIYPIDYIVADKAIYFRSAPGRKLINLTADPVVAFEADGGVDRRRWSVVVRGTANRMDSDSEIEASGVNRLKSHSPTTKWNYVKITPGTITGRRFFTR
jgi:nitroimidazol reductase NimA-like FMN-containing flavoprotein (pyridoxamine 5'-phosphate oxidase superfamily)